MIRPPLILGSKSYDELLFEIEVILKGLLHKLQEVGKYIDQLEKKRSKSKEFIENYKERLGYNQTLYEYLLAMYSRWQSIDYLFAARAIEKARANAHRLGEKEYGFSIFYKETGVPAIQIH